jgi:acyl-CoA reductase-like NAD-dependent aldehyde dehydrogenase
VGPLDAAVGCDQTQVVLLQVVERQVIGLAGRKLHLGDGGYIGADGVGKHFGEIAGGVEVAAAAIAAARRAFETTEWKRDASLRARVLEELAASFERHTDSLVEQLALENGKVRPEASFEVNMVPSKLRYYAALARVERGHSGPPRPDVLSIVLREPMEVTLPRRAPQKFGK